MFPALLLGAMGAMQLVGGIVQQGQYASAGKYAKKVGKYQQGLAEGRAKQLEMQANEERAASQREMLAERQQGNLISGRTRALAAASGASLASPSVVSNMADIGGITDYRVDSARREGEVKAQNLEYGAAVERAGGQYANEMGKYQNSLARQQGQNALISGVMNAGMTGYNAYSAIPAATHVNAVGSANSATMGGYDLGWNSTPGLLQRGAPMYQKYGFGGPT